MYSNRVTITGFLGKDAEARTTRNNNSFTNLSVATKRSWKNRETGERIKSCTMIICEPNEFVAEAHDRMPVLLQPAQLDHWLSGDMGSRGAEARAE